jgi:hypothetical protein
MVGAHSTGPFPFPTQASSNKPIILGPNGMPYQSNFAVSTAPVMTTEQTEQQSAFASEHEDEYEEGEEDEQQGNVDYGGM